MASSSVAEQSLIDRIRRGESAAWADLIARYEGRLLAFVEARVGRRAAAEDIVQETFVGFLTSLPNYDGQRPLESYLFSICAYKLVEAIQSQVDRIRARGEWTKLQCLELLFVGGWANKAVATELGLSEQQVANFKFDFLANLRKLVRKQGLSADVFPELYEE